MYFQADEIPTVGTATAAVAAVVVASTFVDDTVVRGDGRPNRPGGARPKALYVISMIIPMMAEGKSKNIIANWDMPRRNDTITSIKRKTDNRPALLVAAT